MHAIQLRRFFLVLVWSILATVATAQVGIGDKREDILAKYGRPTSIARRGDHEIFLYPKGARIELVNGLVADVKGPLPEPVAPAAVAPDAAPPAPPPVEPVAAAPAVAAPVAAPPMQAPPAPPTAPVATPAVRETKIPKTPAEFTGSDAAEDESAAHEHVDSPFASLPAFFIGLVLRFGLTIVALKLAFKYWEMDAFWSGILLIAAIDLGLHALCELLGPVTGGLTTMSAFENGVPGLVLIYTINRFCFNKRLQNAVATAAAVKVVVTLLYLFGAVALLNLAYG